MKINNLFLLFFLIFFTSHGLLFAQEDSTVSNREKIIQDRLQNREEIQQKLQAAREEFKTKIAEIKDARKKTLVEKIDQKMTTLNKNRTTQMTEHLQKLTAILTRLEAKAPGLAEVISAKQAIEVAQIAITAQAAKQYTAQITDETTLRANLGTQVKALEADLKIVRELIQTAHKSVITALQAVKKQTGEKRGQPTVTVTPTITN